MTFTDLDTSTVGPDEAATLVVEFLVWWHQAGREYYRRGEDDGIKAFASDAVSVIGGWRPARRLLRSLDRATMTLAEAKGLL